MFEPSRTSQAVALDPGRPDPPHTPDGDADAQRRLTVGFRTGGGPGLVAHMQARTALVDDAVLSAVAAGVTQVVVVGAGYDDEPCASGRPACGSSRSTTPRPRPTNAAGSSSSGRLMT